MSIPIYAAAIASASRRRPVPRVSQYDIDKTIHEGELLYGEICHVCETHLGDPIGEPRLCAECAKTYVPPEDGLKLVWLGILGAICGVITMFILPFFGLTFWMHFGAIVLSSLMLAIFMSVNNAPCPK